jgi:PadR family transcriptional regulator AphA
VFFAENGTTADLLATLTAAQAWASARCAESLAIGEQYSSGSGPFPERLPELQLTSRFLTDFYLLVGQWARWAATIAETWPDDPRQAKHDPEVIAETVRRAADGATPPGG